MSVQDIIRNRAYDEVNNATTYLQGCRTQTDEATTIRITIEQGHVVDVKRNSDTTFNDRALWVEQFIKNVCESITNKHDITCVIRVGLHDSYPIDVEGLLVFSKITGATGQILIPDGYAMNNYNGKLCLRDNIPPCDKIQKAYFVGVTTGDSDPALNMRLQLCDWARKHNDVAKCYISDIVQMSHDDVAKNYPSYKEFCVFHWIDMEQQRKYAYLINLDGNTCAWDRLPWIMASNSICLKHRSSNINWYYPLLQSNVHFKEFDNFDEIPFLMQCPFDNTIVSNANKFAEEFLSIESHMYYMGEVLRTLSKIK